MAKRTEHFYQISRIIRPGDVVRAELAYLYNLPLAHEVFVLCAEQFPEHEIYMTHGARVIRQHPEGCWERWYEEMMGRSDQSS